MDKPLPKWQVPRPNDTTSRSLRDMAESLSEGGMAFLEHMEPDRIRCRGWPGVRRFYWQPEDLEELRKRAIVLWESFGGDDGETD